MQNTSAASIYVGDLDKSVTEASLYEIFNAVGPVATVKVVRDSTTRESKGYAFINFHTSTDAERALDTMNFAMIKGRPCRIMWSNRDRSVRDNAVGNIVVKNLDKSIDHKTLYDTFSMFGDILSCKVGCDKEGNSLGYGFVHYVDPTNAQKAIERINGMVIAEKEVSVEPYVKPSERNEADNATYTNLYVRGLVQAKFDAEGFEGKLRDLGEVVSCLVPTKEDGSVLGYAYANYADHDTAVKAETALNEIEGISAARAMSKTELKNAKRKDSEKKPNVNLYVKNLGPNVDDAKLAEIFEEFGSTESVRVMVDSQGQSRGFGFVQFSEESSASKAMSEMNEKVIDGKKLYVGLAQSKSERQAILNKRFSIKPPQQYRPMLPGFPPYRQGGFPMTSYGPAPGGFPAAAYGGMPMRSAIPTRSPMPLNTGNLIGKSNADIKQVLGEKLYKHVSKIEPQKAGKITGMLLEMDYTEVMHLLEDRDALLSKVNDALLILQHAAAAE